MSEKEPYYFEMSDLEGFATREIFRILTNLQGRNGTGWIRGQISKIYGEPGFQKPFSILNSQEGMTEIIRILYQTSLNSKEKVERHIMMIKGEIDRNYMIHQDHNNHTADAINLNDINLHEINQ